MITLPTTIELYEAIIASYESNLDATIDEEGKAALNADALNLAGRLKQYYLGIAALQKNIFVDTCDEETLLRVGLVKLGRLPFSAVAGQYTVELTGTTGGVVDAQFRWKSDDTSLNPGVLYILDEEHTMAGSTDQVVVRALNLGEEGKLNIGDTLSGTSPIPLVDKIATVISEDVQPLAGEDIEDYREKVLNSYRLEAQGGSATDYRIWSADAQGVAKVYPYAKSGATSEINLYIEATENDSTDGKGTPSAQTLLDVEEVVNFNPDDTLDTNERGRRPLNVIVNYLPVTIKAVVITISGFQDLDADIEADLLTAFTNMIANMRPFVASADIQSEKNDILDTNKLIGAIIATRPGSVFAVVTFTVDGVAQTTYTFANGDIPWLNPAIVYS